MELLALFLLKERKPATLKTLESFSYIMLYFALLRQEFRKEKDKYKKCLMNESFLILPRIQRKVVLLVLRTVFAVGF